MTLPTEDQTRDALGISFQERRINALMMASSSEIVTLGHYLHGGGGLQLEVEFEDVLLPGQQDENSRCSPNCKVRFFMLIFLPGGPGELRWPRNGNFQKVGTCF